MKEEDTVEKTSWIMFMIIIKPTINRYLVLEYFFKFIPVQNSNQSLGFNFKNWFPLITRLHGNWRRKFIDYHLHNSPPRKCISVGNFALIVLPGWWYHFGGAARGCNSQRRAAFNPPARLLNHAKWKPPPVTSG